MNKSSNNILPLDLHKYSTKKSILDELPGLNNNKKIKLRARHIPSKNSPNKHSLFLDACREGKRERRYLKIYIDLNKNSKIKDREAMKIAIELRDSLELELFQNEQNFELSNHKRKINFVEYFRILIEKRKYNRDSAKPWKNTYNYLKRFTRNYIQFKNIDDIFCRKFKDYLLEHVTKNTAHTYFARLKAALNFAIQDKIIIQNPAQFIQIKKEEVEREFLTEDELRKLKNVPCKNEQTKRAFLFTCFTGLRFSDVYKLELDEIQDRYLRYKQKKTKGTERVKLSVNALEIIEAQRLDGISTNKVFNLQSHSNTSIHIKEWALNAGINKKITWHVGRHTFATLALTYDNDLYTVSKLLGHREVRTTQIYARLIDKKKDEAIDKLPTI